MPTLSLTVGCLGGSTVPGPTGTSYVVAKVGHLVSLEVLWEKVSTGSQIQVYSLAWQNGL